MLHGSGTRQDLSSVSLDRSVVPTPMLARLSIQLSSSLPSLGAPHTRELQESSSFARHGGIVTGSFHPLCCQVPFEQLVSVVARLCQQGRLPQEEAHA